MRPLITPTAILRLSTCTSYRLVPPRPQSIIRNIRAMTSSSEPQKFEWLVILPDTEGAIAKRMEVRPAHLGKVAEEAPQGFWKLGGAYFSELPKEGQSPPPIIGSAMVAYAATKEEVLERLKNDIYTKTGVWDWDKVQIYPFRSAVRTAL